MGVNKKLKSIFFLSKFSKSPFFAMSTRIYPMYQKGNPQLRVFLPNFWMKMVKPNYNQYGASTPANKVQFIVSSAMTKHDVKNYLEKIYQVDVADMKTLNHMGKTFRNQVANP